MLLLLPRVADAAAAASADQRSPASSTRLTKQFAQKEEMGNNDDDNGEEAQEHFRILLARRYGPLHVYFSAAGQRPASMCALCAVASSVVVVVSDISDRARLRVQLTHAHKILFKMNIPQQKTEARRWGSSVVVLVDWGWWWWALRQRYL